VAPPGRAQAEEKIAMSDGPLGERKKALEDSFFAKENAKLLANLRDEREKRAAKEGLAEMSGIDDGALLDKLVSLDITPDSWAALALVPLVEVAWADGKMDDKERRAVLTAAEAGGVTAGTPSAKLLESWLSRRPDGRLMESWGAYIVEICGSLGVAERARLCQEIVGRARTVAEATGGLLGFGNRVGPEEKIVLSELEKAFDT
jgi:hypothetical protein